MTNTYDRYIFKKYLRIKDFPHMILNDRVQDKMSCFCYISTGHITFFVRQYPMSDGCFDCWNTNNTNITEIPTSFNKFKITESM